MARATPVTKLSLDEFAQIIGLNPFNFNGFSSATYFKNNTCGDIFFQYDWQHSDRLGRETIAMAIQQAEDEMEAEAGFPLMPSWIEDERVDYPSPGRPGVFGLSGLNTRGLFKSIEARRGHVISGGKRKKVLLERASVVTRTDENGDGYAETATVTTPVTFTETDEVRIYYVGMDADDSWEIRPATVAITGGFATIKFKSWQIPVHNHLEDLNATPLDGDLIASYETIVDVYRVYSDPSEQLQFIWENDSGASCCGSCVACQLSTQYGCFHLRDPRIGILVPAPGTWNTSTEEFDNAEFNVCRDPDQVKLWYVAGWTDGSVKRPYVEMSNVWKYAVAYFAVSKFEREVCGCSNVNQFVAKWRRDAAFTSMQEGGFSVTAEMMSNKLGTSMGALYAYRVIHSNGRRVIK